MTRPHRRDPLSARLLTAASIALAVALIPVGGVLAAQLTPVAAETESDTAASLVSSAAPPAATDVESADPSPSPTATAEALPSAPLARAESSPSAAPAASGSSSGEPQGTLRSGVGKVGKEPDGSDPAGAGDGGDSSDDGGITASTEFQAEIVALVNEARAEEGLGALSVNTKLTRAAKRHAIDQAEMQQMAHVGSDGTRGGDRILDEGYRWCSWGENVAYGYTSAQSVFTAWMNSPTHRENILKSKFIHIGLATAVGENGVTYWAQEFAVPC